MTDRETIARVLYLQNSPRPWRWRFATSSPEHMLALLCMTLDDSPYRSPHSEAGTLTRCAGIPAASCVSGGWVRDGICLREECDVPADVATENGVCSLRESGAPALTPQTSNDSQTLPRVQRGDEPSMRAWLARLLKAACEVGEPSVKRAAMAYRSHDAMCIPADSLALGVWAHAVTRELRPWEAL